MTDCATVLDMNLNRETLRVLRERSGMSKAELAGRAAVSPALITRLENGERQCTPSVMRKLAEALQVSQVALMGPNDDGAAA
jgi:transcriptional regulator with XRE-family HTH domain